MMMMRRRRKRMILFQAYSMPTATGRMTRFERR
jgi:hypothetical protein